MFSSVAVVEGSQLSRVLTDPLVFFGNPQGRTDGKAEQWTKLGKEVTRKIDVF